MRFPDCRNRRTRPATDAARHKIRIYCCVRVKFVESPTHNIILWSRNRTEINGASKIQLSHIYSGLSHGNTRHWQIIVPPASREQIEDYPYVQPVTSCIG